VTTYRLFPATSGPATATSYSGNYLAAVGFEVTASGLYLTGYWWWCCGTGQQTTAVKHALWEQGSGGTGAAVVPGSTVTSGTLTAGAWNYTALPAPLALSVNVFYQACVGFVSTGGFPETDNQFGTGQPLASGITSGPLFAYGNNPTPSGITGQSQFSSTAGSDPAAGQPVSTFNNANFWMDLQVTDQVPSGATYRLWPSQPYPYNWQPDTANNFTLATEFSLSQACQVSNVWFYSPAGTTQLPTDVGIWKVSNQSLVAGTHVVSPSWSGAAGSGWVSCPYTGLNLPAGDYKVAVANTAASPVIWNATTFPYWADAGNPVAPGMNGITTGPLSAPSNATATAPGQSTYHASAVFQWPDTYAPGIGSATYWTDIEVSVATNAPAGAAAVAAAAPAAALAPAAAAAPAAIQVAAAAPVVNTSSSIHAVAAAAAVRAAALSVPPPVAEGTLTASDTAAAVLTTALWPS